MQQEDNGFNTYNGCVHDGDLGPVVTSNAGSGGKGREIVVALCVASRGQGNGTK